jgi:hypothetical protein
MAARPTTPDLLSLHYATGGARAVLDAAATRLPRGWGGFLDQAAGIYVYELKVRTPRGTGGDPTGPASGTLARNWLYRRTGTGAASGRQVYNRMAYLKFVIQGRGAIDMTRGGGRIVSAERRYPLHFWINGQEFYRWRVRRARPNPFHIEAIWTARRRTAAELNQFAAGIIPRSLARNL